MARIVELCGAPGVGKSTIFSNIRNKWRNNKCWVPADFLYPQDKIKFNSISGLVLSIERYFTKEEGCINMRAMKKYEDDFIFQNKDYVDSCWANIYKSSFNETQKTDLRFEKIKYLYNTIQKYQFLKKADTNKIAIMDEGLIHRTVNGLIRRESLEEDKDELNNHLKVMPFPHALVYVETEVGEVVKRLLSRKKTIIGHKFLNTSELQKVSRLSIERLAYVVNTLKENGLPVLHINSRRSPSYNAEQIIEFIEMLHIGNADLNQNKANPYTNTLQS